MSNAVLPDNFVEKIKMVEVILMHLELSCRSISFDSNNSWSIHYTDKQYQKRYINFTWKNINELEIEMTAENYTPNFYDKISFVNVFGKSNIFCLINSNKIKDYFFKTEDGNWHIIDNEDEIKVTYTDSDASPVIGQKQNGASLKKIADK